MPGSSVGTVLITGGSSGLGAAYQPPADAMLNDPADVASAVMLSRLHICEMLLNQGVSVVCLDNFITGSPRNIAPLAGRRDLRDGLAYRVGTAARPSAS
jgi:nucleoside-diphosphate-sugar epimerase